MPTPPYGRATAPWVRFCHILHSTHHSARSRRTRAVSDSTASSGRNSASSRSPALVLGCPFLSFSSTFRSRHQSLYLSSMVGYSNPEIQICKSAKNTRGTTLSSWQPPHFLQKSGQNGTEIPSGVSKYYVLEWLFFCIPTRGLKYWNSRSIKNDESL